MCVFCAAVPATLAAGAAARGQQRAAARQATAENRPAPPAASVPVSKITTAVVMALVAASILYHTQAPA